MSKKIGNRKANNDDDDHLIQQQVRCMGRVDEKQKVLQIKKKDGTIKQAANTMLNKHPLL